MRCTLICWTLMAACNSDKANDTSAVVDSAENWWDVEESDTSVDNEIPEEEDEKPDEEKPDDTSIGAIWAAEVDTNLLTGTWTASYSGETVSCELHYEFDSISSIEDCEDCDFAYSLTLGVQVIDSDLGGCGELEDLSGQTVLYGQGGASIGTYQGIEYFSLMEPKNGDWVASDGYSGLGTDQWVFGLK